MLLLCCQTHADSSHHILLSNVSFPHGRNELNPAIQVKSEQGLPEVENPEKDERKLG